MLKNIENKRATFVCNNCGEIGEIDLREREPLMYLEDFGEYENFHYECTSCGSVEVFNMNIPENENEDDLPEHEKTHRTLLKKLKEMIGVAERE